jgi:hypothetical protein
MVKNTNLARRNVTSVKDRYEKELGQLPDVEPRPVRTTDAAALIEPLRRLQRTIGRLTSASIFLTIALVVLGVADHWTAVQAALIGLDHLGRQLLR